MPLNERRCDGNAGVENEVAQRERMNQIESDNQEVPIAE